MVYVDVPKVRGKIAERGYSISSVAEQLNIDRNTLRNYMKRPEKMPYSVVSRLAEIICDDADEASRIFFAHDLRETKDYDNGGGQ